MLVLREPLYYEELIDYKYLNKLQKLAHSAMLVLTDQLYNKWLINYKYLNKYQS
jgi:hypothetical protein